MKMNNLITIILSLFLIALTTGCDSIGSNSDGPAEVQIQMQVASAQSSVSKLQMEQTMNDIQIEEVKLYVSELELESIRDDFRDFELEDLIISLPLDGSPLVLTEREIPEGVYDEFSLELENDDDNFIGDPDFYEGDEEYSVVVKGTYNGERFVYRSDEDFEIEMDLNPPLEVTESRSEVLVISIDIDSWFTDRNGGVLNPNNSQYFERIDENIERSFEGFEDTFDDDDDDNEDDDDDD
jgi:hypothetical protein